MKILLLEDDVQIQNLIRRLAKRVNPLIEFTVVDAVEKAEQILNSNGKNECPFDVAILDNKDCNGRFALKEGLHLEIQKKYPRMRIVLNSTLGSAFRAPGMESFDKKGSLEYNEEILEFLRSLRV